METNEGKKRNTDTETPKQIPGVRFVFCLKCQRNRLNGAIYFDG